MEPEMSYASVHRFERLRLNPSEKRLEEIHKSQIPIDILPDVAQFQHALTNCDRVVADLEEDIRSAQQALDKLKETLILAKSYAHRIHSISHPIRTIPDDILFEIFRHFVPRSLQIQQDSLDPNTPPWILSRVCRRWRALSISDPQLWRIVDLPLHKYNNVTLNRVVYGLSELLARSGRCDIFLRIREVGRAIVYPKVFSILRRALGRARTMDLQLPFQILKDHFSPWPLTGGPGNTAFAYARLSSLSLEFAVQRHPLTLLEMAPPPNHQLDIFTSAFALTSFTQINGPLISIPWRCLRFYKTESWPGWEVLRRMPFLEELHISLPPASHFTTPTPAIVNGAPLVSNLLPFDRMSSLSLQDMSTVGLNVSPVEYMTRLTTFPRLVTLTLRYSNRRNISFPKLYHPEVLTRLSVCTSKSVWSADDLIALLRSTTNLTHLALGDSDGPQTSSKRLLAELTIVSHSKDPHILPCLKKLEVGPSTMSTYPTYLIRTVVSRGRRREGITSVSVILDSQERLEVYKKAWDHFMSVERKRKEALLKASFGFEDGFVLGGSTEDCVFYLSTNNQQAM